MLIDLHVPLKRLLILEQEKSSAVLEAIKILTFALSWEEPNPECIKKYLHEMQIISKGESLISKIPISQ